MEVHYNSFCRKKYQCLQIYQTFIIAFDYFFTVRVDTTTGQGVRVMSVSHEKVDGFLLSWSSWLVFIGSASICNHLVIGLLQALGKICLSIVNKIYAHLK